MCNFGWFCGLLCEGCLEGVRCLCVLLSGVDFEGDESFIVIIFIGGYGGMVVIVGLKYDD